MSTDPRRVVGNPVEAKACHVTNLAKCGRLYGAQKSSKMVRGKVDSIDVMTNPTTRRSTTFITATFMLTEGKTKTARLNIQSVKAVVVDNQATASGQAMGVSQGPTVATQDNGTSPAETVVQGTIEQSVMTTASTESEETMVDSVVKTMAEADVK